jgi:hypothetical protein
LRDVRFRRSGVGKRSLRGHRDECVQSGNSADSMRARHALVSSTGEALRARTNSLASHNESAARSSVFAARPGADLDGTSEGGSGICAEGRLQKVAAGWGHGVARYFRCDAAAACRTKNAARANHHRQREKRKPMLKEFVVVRTYPGI